MTEVRVLDWYNSPKSGLSIMFANSSLSSGDKRFEHLSNLCNS